MSVALSAVMLSPLQAQGVNHGNWIAPGVIVNNSDNTVMLMAPDGNVESIELTNGGVRWRSSDGAKPVALRAGNVIAQAEDGATPSTLSLVALDRGTGALRGQDSVDLGAGVDTSIKKKPGESFELEAGTYKTASGNLYWRYYKEFLSGPAQAQPPPVEEFGMLQVSPNANILPSPAGFSRSEGRPPYGKPRMRRVAPEDPAPTVTVINVETGQRFRRDGEPVSGGPPGGVGGVVSGDDDVLSVTIPPSGGLYITEGRPGDEFPPTRWLPGDQFGYAADDQHILSSVFIGDITSPTPYRWRVYERGSFAKVADFAAHTAFTPFVVVGNRIIYVRQPYSLRQGRGMQEFPLAIVVRDLASGDVVWTREIRETRHMDPLPE